MLNKLFFALWLIVTFFILRTTVDFLNGDSTNAIIMWIVILCADIYVLVKLGLKAFLKINNQE